MRGVNQDSSLCGTGGEACAACTSPPAAVCISSTVRRASVTPGTCAQGACTYTPVETTCSQGCNAGACIDDICQGCLAPPPAICLGATRRDYSAPGECGASGCTYQPVDSTCAFGCSGGSCLPDPCSGVTCNTPPQSRCTGDVRTSFTAPGTCSAGSCAYTAVNETCPFGCSNGVCLADPCATVTCDSPPAATCQGAVRKGFVTPGSCSGGNCSYLPQDTTCTNGCADGGCLGDPCQGVTCTTPPAPQCASANRRRTFTGPGTCSGGSCAYPSTETTCTFGCNSATGECNPDPCTGVSCTMAPAPTCNPAGTARRVFTAPGSCGPGGTCSYPFTETACTSPPASSCVTPSTLRTYNGTGSCADGGCTYAFTDTACQFGCNNNQCNANPCTGVTCTMPPPADCASPTQRRTYSSPGTCDGGTCGYTATVTNCNQPPAAQCMGSTLRTYSASGTCSGGACQYTFTDTACMFGCSGGACAGDPCSGVTCTMPPAPDCADATTRRTYNATGQCSGGQCSYGTQTFPCTSPPQATCLNATTRRTFAAVGSCDGGACTYTPSDSMCPFGCNPATSQCNPDPCIGVNCNSPPAADCVNTTTRRVYSPTGTCADGGCSYGSMSFPCDSPPAPVCFNSSTRRTFAAAGLCSGGICTYAPTDTPCPFGCSGGACNPDPCTGIMCTTPPPAICADSTTRRVFTAPGSCSAGVCDYPSMSQSCAPTPPADCANTTTVRTYGSGSCMDGGCTYPTTLTVCNSPPPQRCLNPTTLRTFGAGTCSGGTCQYASTDITCGNGCVNDACVPCIAGQACTTNPGGCFQGVTACPGGVNGATVCQNGTAHPAGTDPRGSCGLYTCNGVGACYASCATTCATECKSNAHCSGSVCVADGADGASCSQACQCTSGQCTSAYNDGDRDGFGAGPLLSRCGPIGAGRSTNNTDCCDSDSRAFPGAGFGTTPTDCGGFDFNCNGTVEQEATAQNARCDQSGCTACVGAGSVGWVGTRPACGVGGTYQYSCTSTTDPEPCFPASSSTFCDAPDRQPRTQACR